MSTWSGIALLFIYLTSVLPLEIVLITTFIKSNSGKCPALDAKHFPISAIIFSLFCLFSGIAAGATETFYACNGGTAANPKFGTCVGAFDITHLSLLGSYAAVDASDGKIGPNDEVIFLDDGGMFRGVLTISASGLPGKPITFKAKADDNPKIVLSERFANSDWQLFYNSGGKKIYRLNIQKNGQRGYWSWYPVTSNDGTSWQRPNMELPSTWSETGVVENLKDKWYFLPYAKTNSYAYYRSDDGVIPAIWEIGFRPKGIVLSNSKNFVIDNIDVFGPGGCSESFAGSFPCSVDNSEAWNARLTTEAVSLVNSQDIILKNLEISYGGYFALQLRSSTLSKNIMVDNVDIHHMPFAMHFKGTYSPHVQGSQNSKNVTVQNSRIYEIGTRPKEEGDRELIGFLGIDGGTVRNNYLGTQSHDYEGELQHLSNQVAIVTSRNILIENNYFYDAGSRHIETGGGGTDLSTKDITIRNNIFDRRGSKINDDFYTTGVSIGCCRNYEQVKPDCDTNYPSLGAACYGDHSGKVIITNNLFINGRNLYGWKEPYEDGWSDWHWATLVFKFDKFDSIEVSNNIFYKNGALHEISFGQHSGTVSVKNNIFFEDASSDWNKAVILDGGVVWDRDHIGCTTKGCYNVDRTYASGNRNVDPLLVSISPGAQYSKALKTGSPAIDSGYDLDPLGAGFAQGISPATDFTAKPLTVIRADQNSYGSGWEIGPYVSTGAASCTPNLICQAWSSWSSCVNSQQSRTRTCTDANKCIADKTETETQACACQPSMICSTWSSWSACVNSQQTRTRTCTDANKCVADKTETETQACVSTVSLIGHWKFDEGAGTVAKDETGKNGGTINGATWTDGRKGKALLFDGVDDHVIVQNSVSLNPSYLTVSLWFRPETLRTSAGLIAKGDNVNRQYWTWIHEGNLSLEVDEGVYQNYLFSLRQGEWYHAAYTYDGSAIQVYINGTKIKSIVQVSGPILTDDDPLYIGTLPGFPPFNGVIDEVRIYDGPLSGGEILVLAQEKDCFASVLDSISRWKKNELGILEVVATIKRWKSGC